MASEGGFYGLHDMMKHQIIMENGSETGIVCLPKGVAVDSVSFSFLEPSHLFS